MTPEPYNDEYLDFVKEINECLGANEIDKLNNS